MLLPGASGFLKPDHVVVNPSYSVLPAFRAMALLVPNPLWARLEESGLALSEAFMGEAKRAQAHFETLLSIEPDVDVSRGLGPKIRKPYDAARKKLKDPKRAVLSVERRDDGRVKVTVEDAPAVATVVQA